MCSSDLPTDVTSIDYLIVGGGGAAGTSYGGGGGAGGYRTGTSLSVTPGSTITVTVGAGGAGNAPSPLGQFGGDGSNTGIFSASPFPSIWSNGGGGGAWSGSRTGTSGGSGGGGGGTGSPAVAGQTFPGGAGTPGQGNSEIGRAHV